MCIYIYIYIYTLFNIDSQKGTIIFTTTHMVDVVFGGQQRLPEPGLWGQMIAAQVQDLTSQGS